MSLNAILPFFFAMNVFANSNTLDGFWSGSMSMNGKSVDISFDLNGKNQLFSSNDVMLLDQPISNLIIKNENISFTVTIGVKLDFKGTIRGNEIAGTTTIDRFPSDVKITFSAIKQAERPVKPYVVESQFIKSNDVLLAAEIYKPLTKEPHPALVILHGSDANLLTLYRFMAAYFARLGFEVLIFDKRGCGKSTGDYKKTLYSDLIADAIVCLKTLQERESVNKDKIGLFGISQGAMLSPKVAAESNIPSFFIGMSPEVISVVEAAAFADSLRVLSFGGSESDAKIVTESHRKVGEMIREGKSHIEVETFIRENAGQYNFMNQTGLYGSIRIDKNDFKAFYWKNRADYFLPYRQDLKIPTLVLLGGKDYLINSKKNFSILHELNKECIKIKFFPDAGHNLEKTFNPAIDKEFDWPRTVDGFFECLDNWVKDMIIK